MRVFYTVLLVIGAVQLAKGYPLIPPQTAEHELEVEFYKIVNFLAGESCLKLKNISEQILDDEIFEKTSSQIVQQFERNVTSFNEVFPFYLRFGYNETLLATFAQLVKDFQQAAASNDKDFMYVRNLLTKLGLKDISENYKRDFMKLLPKLQTLKTNVSDEKYFIWIYNLEKCTSFECCLNSRQKHIFTAKDNFVGFLQKQLMNMCIRFANNATLYSERLLNEPKLSQLSENTRNMFISRVQYCVNATEFSENIYHIFFVPIICGNSIFYFTDKDDISLKELRLIDEILNENGYEMLMSNLRTNYNNFLQYDMLKELERVKGTLSQEELMREVQFWDAIEKVRDGNTFEERVNIVNRISKFEFNKLMI